MISRLRDAEIYRWIRAHQFEHFCCVICSSALFPIRSNTLACHCCWLRPASARMFRISRIWAWMWGSTKCCLSALFKQLWACSMGLKNEQYGGNITTWNLSWNSSGTTMLRCGRAPSKMMKTSSLIGTRGAKMTSNSLMKAWKVARVTVLCPIAWWTKPMSGDMASVMLTFLPRGATTRRTRSLNGARPLLLQVKMLNLDSSMYTWRWWTPVKEGIDDVARTGKCEYWPRLTNHAAYWKRRSIVLGWFLSYGTSLSFPAILVVMSWFWRCWAMIEFKIAVSGKRTASSWPNVTMVVKGCCSTKSLMKACMYVICQFDVASSAFW